MRCLRRVPSFGFHGLGCRCLTRAAHEQGGYFGGEGEGKGKWRRGTGEGGDDTGQVGKILVTRPVQRPTQMQYSDNLIVGKLAFPSTETRLLQWVRRHREILGVFASCRFE